MSETGLDGIADGKYYTAAANWAVEKGVITGFEREGGTFDFAADDAVSFEQMVAILSRLCAAPDEAAAAGGDLSRFVDGDEASPGREAPSRGRRRRVWSAATRTRTARARSPRARG